MKRCACAIACIVGLAGQGAILTAPASPPLDKNVPARTETATFALG